jgi:hypothetical protein
VKGVKAGGVGGAVCEGGVWPDDAGWGSEARVFVRQRTDIGTGDCQGGGAAAHEGT